MTALQEAELRATRENILQGAVHPTFGLITVRRKERRVHLARNVLGGGAGDSERLLAFEESEGPILSASWGCSPHDADTLAILFPTKLHLCRVRMLHGKPTPHPLVALAVPAAVSSHLILTSHSSR